MHQHCRNSCHAVYPTQKLWCVVETLASMEVPACMLLQPGLVSELQAPNRTHACPASPQVVCSHRHEVQARTTMKSVAGLLQKMHTPQSTRCIVRKCTMLVLPPLACRTAAGGYNCKRTSAAAAQELRAVYCSINELEAHTDGTHTDNFIARHSKQQAERAARQAADSIILSEPSVLHTEQKT